MPRSLDLDRLKRFEARPAAEKGDRDISNAPAADKAPERWPSREPVRDGQISIKAPINVLDRFRKLCKDDRRTYADMLEILMDRSEKST